MICPSCGAACEDALPLLCSALFCAATSTGDCSDCLQRDAQYIVQAKLPGQSCKRASQESAPSVHLWGSWGTCAAACSQAGGVGDTSNCSADLNSLLGLWQGFADKHRFGSYDWLGAQVMRSTGTWKGTEILGLDQNPSSSSSTIRGYWSKDGRNYPWRCLLFLPSTPSLTHRVHIQLVSFPSFP